MGGPTFQAAGRRGPIIDYQGIPTVTGAAQTAFAQTVDARLKTGDSLTIYCRDIAFIDSRAIGQIIGWRKRVGIDGMVTLIGLHPSIADLLSTLRLSGYLTLRPLG